MRVTVDVTVTVPDREPDEPDVTAEQIRELRALGTVSNPMAEAQLGRRQAEFVIRELRRRRTELQAALDAQAAAQTAALAQTPAMQRQERWFFALLGGIIGWWIGRKK